jgi:hypothetical protein
MRQGASQAGVRSDEKLIIDFEVSTIEGTLAPRSMAQPFVSYRTSRKSRGKLSACGLARHYVIT